MKAAVLTTYGDPATGLEYRDMPEPGKPGVGHVTSLYGSCRSCDGPDEVFVGTVDAARCAGPVGRFRPVLVKKPRSEPGNSSTVWVYGPASPTTSVSATGASMNTTAGNPFSLTSDS
jgi:hypothetical protein